MGKVIMSGIVPLLTNPISGILASTLAVGSTVKLMEGGTEVEFLVVHQGLPGSIYDASCEGCWLLRKNVKENRVWTTTNYNQYAASTVNTWLNNDYINSFGALEQSLIKTVKIPYVNGTGSGGSVASGANGLSVKAFLLSARETHGTSNYFHEDGEVLSYFTGYEDDASRRIAYLDGIADYWWFRSPPTHQKTQIWGVTDAGAFGFYPKDSSYGIRPAVILPSDALFDKNTLILKGVA